MSTPELDDYWSGFSPEDQRFLIEVQRTSLYEKRPLTYKLREGILGIFSSSKTRRVLLISGIGATLAGLGLGDPVIFTGGVGLFSFWQTSNLASYWRDVFIID